MVKCHICGESFNTISWKHLARHQTNLTQYKQRFPTAEIRSKEASLRKSEGARRANQHRKGVPRPAEIKDKISTSKRLSKHEPWNKGIPMSTEQRVKLSQAKKQLYQQGKITHWNLGNATPENVRKKISETAKSQHRTYSEKSKELRALTIQAKIEQGWIHPAQRAGWTEKIRQRSQELYGVDNWMQRHLDPSVIELLNSHAWLYDQHVTQQKPITQICQDLGLHWKNSNAMVRRRLQSHGIEQQYHASSSFPEQEIAELLTQWDIGYTRNDRTVIRPKELDIVIPSKKIAIEYCGLIWHSDAFVDDKNYHFDKLIAANKQGYRLITIFEDEWLHRRTQVIEKLRTILSVDKTPRIYARKCTIIDVDRLTKTKFFDTHHIQGNGPSSVNVGIQYEGQVIGVMGFIKQSSNKYVLSRFATSQPVQGGFSKILANFCTRFPGSEIVSFADRRWSNADVYTKNGFVVDKSIAPDYAYIDAKQRVRIHKFNFRHSRLRSILGDQYDQTLTEHENTQRAGWHKIYNCGLIRVVFHPETANNSIA